MFDLDELLKNKTVMMVLGVVAVITIMNMFRAGRCRRRLRRVRENFAAAAAMGSGRRRRRKSIENFACPAALQFCKKQNPEGPDAEIRKCMSTQEARDKCGGTTMFERTQNTQIPNKQNSACGLCERQDMNNSFDEDKCKSKVLPTSSYALVSPDHGSRGCDTLKAAYESATGSTSSDAATVAATTVAATTVTANAATADTAATTGGSNHSEKVLQKLKETCDELNSHTTEGFGNTAPSRQVTTNTGKVYNFNFN